MLSHGMLQAIETQSEVIMESVVEQILNHPDLKHLRKVPVADLRGWGCYILNSLGNWLIAGTDTTLARRYDRLDGLRFKECVPVHEVVHALHLLRRNTIDFVRDQGTLQTPLEILGEDEVEHLLAESFDWLEEHLLHGYEKAAQQAAHKGS